MIAALIWAWIVFAATKPCVIDSSIHYRGRVFKNCAIVGYSGTDTKKTYALDCEPRLAGAGIQIEIHELDGEMLDPISRRRISKCEIRPAVRSRMVKTFEAHRARLENPDCFLSDGGSQLSLHVKEKIERCSFEMNKAAAEEFSAKTRVAPYFQCEAGDFLGKRSAKGTPVWVKSADGWSKICDAGLVRSPVPKESDASAAEGYLPPPPHVTPDR